MDIVVANTWAKSLLRAVAQEWALAHNNLDYFPSYEIVQNSDRAAAWERNLRHVRGRRRTAYHGAICSELYRVRSGKVDPTACSDTYSPFRVAMKKSFRWCPSRCNMV
jgi:hypothetical protein